MIENNVKRSGVSVEDAGDWVEGKLSTRMVDHK